VSTVLSTPGRQEAIGGSYLDIGMGGHFEGFGVVKASYQIAQFGAIEVSSDKGALTCSIFSNRQRARIQIRFSKKFVSQGRLEVQQASQRVS
jgi:hypothetical protein